MAPFESNSTVLLEFPSGHSETGNDSNEPGNETTEEDQSIATTNMTTYEDNREVVAEQINPMKAVVLEQKSLLDTDYFEKRLGDSLENDTKEGDITKNHDAGTFADLKVSDAFSPKTIAVASEEMHSLPRAIQPKVHTTTKFVSLSSNAMPPRTEMICNESLDIWCAGNDLSPKFRQFFENHGAESFLDLLELSEEDKLELIESTVDLKFFEKKKILNALNAETLAVYEQCIKENSTLPEFSGRKKAVHAAKDCKEICSNVVDQRGSGSGTSGKEEERTEEPKLWLEKGGTGGKDARTVGKVKEDSNPTGTPPCYCPLFPEGTHIAPHKIIVLDREKAVRDNPSLMAKDFFSLTSDKFTNPLGGELKIVLFVGATGSGKSTTINSYVNFLYGVKYDDPFRLKLVNEPANTARATTTTSQTNQVIGYLLECPPALGGKDSILIIDTPGFGDTRGVGRDLETVDEVKTFFNKEVNYLHAVCFVVQGNATRLDTQNRWIFDQVLGLFGKNIREIITLLMTFSDAAEPPAMAVINDAGIEYEERFKLNNSAYFLPTTAVGRFQHDYAINSMFWNVGQTAFDSLSKFILGRKEKSLLETKTVLSRREEIKNRIENIRMSIEIGMNSLERVETTIPNIIKAQTLIESNKDFEFEVTEMKVVKKPKVTLYNTICTNCNWTCHYDCELANNSDKMGCAAMDKNSGYCKCCPKKCHWSDHQNLDYYYARVSEKKKQTNKELYDRYVNANSDKSKFDQVLDGLRAEFEETQKEVYDSVLMIQDMSNELQKIALRPSLYHDDEYFDIMVECERKEKREGWKGRIEAIKKVKERSKMCHDINSDGYDPFAERVAQVKERAMTGKINIVLPNEEGKGRSRSGPFVTKRQGNPWASCIVPWKK